MPKKNYGVCSVIFKDFEGSVKGLFSSEHLINCYSSSDKMRYMDIINNPKIKEVFEDKELFNTISCFFKNDLNIAKASKENYMHRNTLIYRLSKVERLTGLQLRRFEDAVIFINLMYVRENLLNQKNRD